MEPLFWRVVAKVVSQPRIANYLIKRAMRTPYSHIRSVDGKDIYMARYWLFNPYPIESESDKTRPKWQFPISARIHNIRREDLDRHLHDHPWNCRTIILKGWYCEQRRKHEDGRCEFNVYGPGSTARLRFGLDWHKINHVTTEDDAVWTLFIIGKYRGTWGFNVDGVKVPHWEYLKCKHK